MKRLEYKWIVASVLVVSLFMDILDATIVNVALPTLSKEFDASTTTSVPGPILSPSQTTSSTSARASAATAVAPAKGPLIPTAPPDLVAALGAVDRKLYVVPSLGLVITRLGNSAGPAFQNEFWKLLMEAAPAK